MTSKTKVYIILYIFGLELYSAYQQKVTFEKIDLKV